MQPPLRTAASCPWPRRGSAARLLQPSLQRENREERHVQSGEGQRPPTRRPAAIGRWDRHPQTPSQPGGREETRHRSKVRPKEDGWPECWAPASPATETQTPHPARSLRETPGGGRGETRDTGTDTWRTAVTQATETWRPAAGSRRYRPSRGDGRGQALTPGGAPPRWPPGPQRDSLPTEATAMNRLPCTHTTEAEVAEGPPPNRLPVPSSSLRAHVPAMGSVQRAPGAELLAVGSRGAGAAPVGESGVPWEESAGPGGTGLPPATRPAAAARARHRAASHMSKRAGRRGACPARGLSAPQTARPALHVHAPHPPPPAQEQAELQVSGERRGVGGQRGRRCPWEVPRWPAPEAQPRPALGRSGQAGQGGAGAGAPAGGPSQGPSRALELHGPRGDVEHGRVEPLAAEGRAFCVPPLLQHLVDFLQQKTDSVSLGRQAHTRPSRTPCCRRLQRTLGWLCPPRPCPPRGSRPGSPAECGPASCGPSQSQGPGGRRPQGGLRCRGSPLPLPREAAGGIKD